MVPAKKFGVKVTQYMVGFGPTVWSRKKGDTEYGLKGIPLGGYIRMIGMVPPRADGKPSRWPRRMSTAIEDFRQVQPLRGRARRRAAPVLPADARQEDDRHARRAVHEPGHLPRPHPDHPHHLRRAEDDRDDHRRARHASASRRPARRRRRRTTAPVANSPAARRRAEGRRPHRRRRTARRSTNFDQLVAADRAGRRADAAPRGRSATASTITLTATPVRNMQVRRTTAAPRRRSPASSASRRRPTTTTSRRARWTSPARSAARSTSACRRSPATRRSCTACGRRCSRARSAIPQGAIGVVGIGRLGGEISRLARAHAEGQDLHADRACSRA